LSKKREADKNLLEKFIDQSTGEPLDLLDQNMVRLALKSAGGKQRMTPDEDFEMDPEGRIIVKEEWDKRKKNMSLVMRRLMIGPQSEASPLRRETSSSGWAYTGHEYTSKKARGDLTKKDKMEPYADWPLDRKLLNRRSPRGLRGRVQVLCFLLINGQRK
jgi:ribosomal RNA-processing protein 12